MAKKILKKGVFITFEGPEGCGKSTQSRLLYQHLKAGGYRVVHTREPGGTGLGERIRSVLLDPKGPEISDAAELFLFEAARAQIVREVILPALRRKAVVVSDRFSDATLAYQGYAGRIGFDAVRRVDAIATGALKPDLTILLDIDSSLGLERATKKRVDRMERKPLPYHVKVRRGYLLIARADPKRVKVIAGTGDIRSVQELIRTEVARVFQGHQRAG